YPPGYMATASLLSFGAGMAVGAAVWGDCDWDSHDVYHDYDHGGGGGDNNNPKGKVHPKGPPARNTGPPADPEATRAAGQGNRGERQGERQGNRGERQGNRGQGGGREKWSHDASKRGGVRYRDNATAQKYGGRDQVASRDRANRDQARGYDRSQGAGGNR